MQNSSVIEKANAETIQTPPDVESRRVQLGRFLELLSAILISLATVGSSWCAYQSSRWNGVQKLRLNEANFAQAESVRMSNAAMQMLSIDIGMFNQFTVAYSEKNQFLWDFVYLRFRPEMKVAVDAWLALDPLGNPEAPSSPFVMAEYNSVFSTDSDKFLLTAKQKIEEAVQANQRSDNYFLLTVLYASVLFFGGIGPKFNEIKIRATLLIFAVLLFLTIVVILATYPIY